MPKVSIIVPVYNVEKYLRKCIESILEQDEKDFELILVDDGSQDKSGIICDEYAKKDSRIIVLHNSNQGPSMARNAGLDICNGKYVTFVDSDDYIENNYLTIMLEKIEKKNADLVICGYRQIMNLKSEIHAVSGDAEIFQDEFIKGLLIQKGYGMNACKLYKRELIGDNRFDSTLTVGEDSFFILQISKNLKKCLHIADVLYNYNVNEQSLVRKYNENYLNNYMKSAKIIKEYIYNNFDDEELKKLTNNYIVFTLTLVIINYCFNPKRNQGKILKETKEIHTICNLDEYKTALKNIKLEYFSTARKIMVLALKMKLYFIASLIGHVRQLQMKGK